MKRLLFITLPHGKQRYPTVGDYEDVHGCTMFRISDMGNWKYEVLVAVHEFIEKILVDARGIKVEDIDAFDMAFEAARQPGDDREPGHESTAPYHKEHVFAEKVERMLAAELGVDWNTYDRTVVELSQ